MKKKKQDKNMALSREVELMNARTLRLSDMGNFTMRPGAENFLKIPSLIGNERVYRPEVNNAGK